ncbi:hypothetical protein EVAR_101430_1 [Eumeta japonica]|uniref:Uncharacterized protein n=1 Tax=Eumeta variegata TaxID=151549 RepID=A0A4C1TS62_EUMVA|nr:hypothetical protein EVAR_101430_1 [Eumeta japonica]
MQYNLQQQQTQQQQQQIISEIANSLPGASGTNNLQSSSSALTSSGDALTTNDLDALLPTLSCDIESSLSLDDKNELESLLQDAKTLDLIGEWILMKRQLLQPHCWETNNCLQMLS